MSEDRWGKTVYSEFMWAVGGDSCVALRIGAEFAPDGVSAVFYEDTLPELRAFVALLARNMEIQERGAQSHGRTTDAGVDWLRKELTRLLAALPSTQPGV